MEGEGGEEQQVTPPPPGRSIIQMAPPATTSHPRPSPTDITSAGGKKKRRFHCAVENCTYSTPYAKDLARHMRKHTGEKPFSCDQCSKSYSRYDKLICHLRIHEGIRLFKCSECSYAGIDSAALKKHQRTHTNERPYKCQLCPYAAKASTQLAVHLRSHTGDSPYFCTHGECDAAFKTLSDLQRHARLHTGEKPFACTEPGCSYKAAVKSNLNVHLRRHQTTKDKNKHQHVVRVQANNDDPDLRTSGDGVESWTTPTVDEPANPTKDNTDDVLESNLIELGSNCDRSISSSSMCINGRIDLVSQTQTQPTTNPPTKKSRLLSAHVSEEPQVSSQVTSLPFQYACKMCPFKADSLDVFESHMKSIHSEDIDTAISVATTDISKHTRSSPSRTGRPRPSRRTKPSTTKNSSEDLETYFDCPYCSASFVREDSLRCHLRQHSTSTPPVHLTLNKRSIVHVAPTNSTVELTSIPTEALSLPFHQPLQVATTSVITQNPQSLPNSDFPSDCPHRQVYIVSPGGSTIRALNPHSEETHFHIQE